MASIILEVMVMTSYVVDFAKSLSNGAAPVSFFFHFFLAVQFSNATRIGLQNPYQTLTLCTPTHPLRPTPSLDKIIICR